MTRYREQYGKDPIIVVIPGADRVRGRRPTSASARTALATFTDALRVARDADRIGTVRCLDAAERGFIENWEAESYRKSVAASASAGRMAGQGRAGHRGSPGLRARHRHSSCSPRGRT